MSTATQKPLGESAQAGPAFSYAQAAKGKSPSVSSTPPSGKTPAESTEMPTKMEPTHDTKTASTDQDKSILTRSTSESHDVQGKDLPNGHLPEVASSIDGVTSANAASPLLSPKRRSVSQSQPAPSTPSSPSFGTASTSTLPKEEDEFSVPNGSSDSTWDKQSQTSQVADRNHDKPEDEKNQAKSNSWDKESPTPAPLKAAPPPAVNVWQQRKEAMEAKAKAGKPITPVRAGSSNGGMAQTNGAPRSSENSPDSHKPDNTRRKSKAGPVGSEDKSVGPNAKDTNRPGEGSGKSGTEALNRPFRATRSPDLEKPIAAAAPPPPEDATSWPTPDSAQDEKKKPQEKAEKSEKDRNPGAKPHGKEKWMPVPYVPTAVFNTPLPPRRGGRNPRGGREGSGRGGHVPHGSIGAEKPLLGTNGPSPIPAATQVNERGRADANAPKNAAAPSRPKRAVSAGPPTSRGEQRKQPEPVSQERRKEEVSTQRANQDGGAPTVPSRRTSTAPQTENLHNTRQGIGQVAKEDMNGTRKPAQVNTDRDEKQQAVTSDTHAHPRSAGPDRRAEGSLRSFDYFREFGGQVPVRERGDGRPERGRGGFRGSRGGSNGFSNGHIPNGQQFTNGHLSHHQSSAGFPPSKPHSFTERHGSQGQAAPFTTAPQHSRSFRGGPRSQSIPDAASYGRFPGRPSAGPQHLPPVHTDLANQYGYQQGQPNVMSAMPYNPYMEHYNLFSMVSLQMEYYFSVDNLCKDMFLRKHMDSEGFVFLSVLANFNRIKQLTKDMDLIRYVCLNSAHMEIRTGIDGFDRVRKRDGWQQWILAVEERDPSARNDAPVQMQQPRIPQQQVMEDYYSPNGRSPVSPRGSFSPANGVLVDPEYQSLNGIAPSFIPPASMAMANDTITGTHITQTPLSAAVPDFAPGTPSMHNHGFVSLDSQTHSHSQPQSQPQSQAQAQSHGDNPFTDEQVESLVIVVRKPVSPGAPIRVPFSAASRTFSNGSIDGRTISDELSKFGDRQSHSLTNGDSGSERLDMDPVQRSRSPFALGSPARSPNSNASPVFWVKNKEAPIDSLPNDLTHESYSVFRRNALKQREHAGTGNCHRDMDVLYQFWSHFLIRNFNLRMYDEFRQLAFEDAIQRGSNVGMKNLVQYYDESILGQKVISNEIAHDFLELVRQEKADERPGFDKLRAAWRNGAFNMKNRKKIDTIIDQELKAELEK